MNLGKLIRSAGLGIISSLPISCSSLEDAVKDNSRQVKTEEPQTLANRLFDMFPEYLDGSKVTAKMKVPGAKYLAVHIRQKHHVYGFDLLESFKSEYKGISAEREKEFLKSVVSTNHREVNMVQKEIYETLRELSGYGIRKVWGEGKTNFTNPEDTELLYSYALFCILKDDGIDPLSLSRKEFRELVNEIIYVPGGEMKSAVDRYITLLPGENEILNKNAVNTLYSQDEAKRELLLFKAREDYLLKKIVEYRNENPIVPFTFGAHHCFGDNIVNWNEINPEDKFSLIELTPYSYKELSMPLIF